MPAATLIVASWLTGLAVVAPSGAQEVGVCTRVASSQPSLGAGPDEELVRACERAGEALDRTLGPECRVLVDTPFVLGGDLGPGDLDHWSRKVVRRAAEAMWRSYFKRRPTEPITILVFASERSYRAYAKRLYGDAKVAYYGYYKPCVRTLVMNISTGGGTLLHELTHALMHYDFPDAPTWFSEGMASLHEQCDQEAWRRGELVADVNWRLPALKRALDSGRLRPLRKLITGDDFRGPEETLNYAQARYFCMYLQRHGRLADLYRAFRDGYKEDRTGLSFVEESMRRRRIEVIERDFLAWVRQLHYRR